MLSPSRNSNDCSCVETRDKMIALLMVLMFSCDANIYKTLMQNTKLCTDNLDPAFERRFLYKIMFEKPDAAVRQKIWQLSHTVTRKRIGF